MEFLDELIQKLGANRRSRTEPRDAKLSYNQMTDILVKHANKDFVDKIIKKESGPISWGKADGVFYVVPVGEQSFGESLQMGEAIPFATAAEADYFAKNYKLTWQGKSNIRKAR